MNIQTIRERRANTIQQMRALTETAGREDRDLTDDEARSFDEHKVGLEKLEKQLERAQVVADAERSMQADRSSRRDTFENASQRFQITRAIQAQIDPRATDVGLELEVSQELARRSGKSPRGILVPFAVGPVEQRDVLKSNTGQYTVGTVLRDDLFIEPLRINPVVSRAGALTLAGLVGDQDIPRQTATGTMSTVFEHGDVSETSQTFDQISLSPHTIGAYTEVSRRWLQQSTPSGEQIVRNDLTAAINIEVDRQALLGDPTGTSPNNAQVVGVCHASGISGVAFSAAPSWAKLQSMIGAVAQDNAEMGRIAFIGNSFVRAEFLKTLMASSTDSRHITEDPNMLAGYRYLMSNHMAGNPTTSPMVNGELLYANWSDLIVAFWSGIDILVNPYETSVFKKGGALISAFIDFDVAIRHGESFCLGSAITLTP